MKLKKSIISFLFVISICSAFGQKEKISNYFDNPIIVDSSSTIIIPTRYNTAIFSSNKLAAWGDYFANIIFYNFNTDTYKKLFDNDTYIEGFNNYPSFHYDNRKKMDLTSQWIFYRVKNYDRNKNKKIDNGDPSILYVSDLHGDHLRSLTPDNENVVHIDVFDKQKIALIKIQRDTNNNGDFDSDDTCYFVKIDLGTLTFGNKIEVK